MSKYTDYVKTGANKFVELQDTPDTYDPGKYVKVESNGLNYADVDATLSGINDSGGGLNYKYKFDTATSGTVTSGTFQFNNTNYRAASQINISYFDMNRTDLTTWINSWDDSDKAVKGTATFKAVRDDTKYVTYKLKETGGSMFGSGKDGDVTISGAVNLNTDTLIPGRTYPDMVAYSVTSVGASSCQVSETPNGIDVGDIVLLINLQGAGNYQVDNVGNYEFFTVDEIVATTIVFKEIKSKYYGNNGGDTNIGITTTNQRVMVMRVPQYNSFTVDVDSTVTVNAWDGVKYGVFCMKCAGEVLIKGTITTNALGYRPGWDHRTSGGSYGRGPGDYDSDGVRNLGGGGSGVSPRAWAPGGGAYGTNGGVYTGATAQGGLAYGFSDLRKMYFGSASGGGSHYGVKVGGRGAGILAIIAKEINSYGSITCNGSIGEVGNGAGGSLLFKCNKISTNASTITADGAAGQSAGMGGDGRIAIYHNILMDSFNNVSPTPYTSDLVIAGSSTEYNAEWLNGSGTFDDEEEVFVSYSYNY